MKLHELTQLGAVHAVLAERHAQDQKWGEQNHGLALWNAILTHQVGSFSEALLHSGATADNPVYPAGGPKAGDVRKQIIHVAAVALAILEFIDRHNADVAAGKI